MPRVTVIQIGARHRYAIARIFEKLGYLEQLVTDSNAQSHLGRLLRELGKVVPLPVAAQRLLRRDPAPVMAPKVTSIDGWILKEWQLRRHWGDPVKWLSERQKAWYQLTSPRIRLMRNMVIYTMFMENVDLLIDAREAGCKVALDCFICPMSDRDLYHAKSAYGIDPSPTERNYTGIEEQFRTVLSLADKILCPSQHVINGIERLDPRLLPATVLCPYGSSLSLGEKVERTPVPGRVFWAGADWFRKGLLHLGAAADIIKKTHPEFEFRAAGVTDPEVVNRPEFRNIEFIGKLTRRKMQEEFLKADMFCFPSMSEGMAGVVVEAIATGCPVVTTRESGVDAIEHNRSGILWEGQNPELLAEHILSLALDRQKIGEMAQETAALAVQFTEDAWARRLDEVVRNMTAA